MSVYDNDLRVTLLLDDSFHVFVDGDPDDAVRHVCAGQFGGFVTHVVGSSETDGPGFETADEAIRSLIGEPQ